MKFIDVRSDTVTLPTQEMREAIFHAEVGDDVYDEDPTIKELEKYAAELIGMEAALFVPSGTFGNQLALFTHCKRGDEVILGEDCHIVAHEVGGASVIAGVQLRTVKSENGIINPEEIEKRIRKEKDIHYPDTGLICLENAHSNGKVIPLEIMKRTKEIAEKYNLPIHLDGARLFNAAASLNVEVKEITKNVDSVMFCLSKGLCAPVGSILGGKKDFIENTKKKRKLMGGGLRQAGFLAAAGLIGLKKMTQRLNEDHENAKYLARELSLISEIEIKPEDVEINMVFFKIRNLNKSNNEIVEYFKENGIKINPPEDGMLRFVTNYWVTKEDIDKIVETTAAYIKK